MMARFNRLEFLKRLIKQNIEHKDCKADSDHVVMPETIERRLKDRNYRFIESCIYCKTTILFDYTVDDEGKLKENKRALKSAKSLADYFADIGNNQYHEPHHTMPHEDDHKIIVEACKVCYKRSVHAPLCQDHLLEALLRLKFTDSGLATVIEEMRAGGSVPDLLVQTNIKDVLRYILTRLQGQDLTDFIRLFPAVVTNLKTVGETRIDA